MYNGKAAALKKVRQKLLARALKLLAVEAALHYRSPMADSNFVETSSQSATTDSTFARNSSLPRRLGLWSAVAVLVGSTIGSGIFRSPARIANKLPGPLPLLAIWVTGGLFALFCALTLAEVAGVVPRTRGGFVYIRESWGRLPGV